MSQQVIGRKSPEHEDIPMGKVDQTQYPVDHGVAQGDEGIDRSELKTIDGLLDEITQEFQKDLPGEGVLFLIV